jgi:ketosteroid isomerase-like protein
MKSKPIDIVRSRTVRIGLTVMSVVLTSSLVIAEPTPVKSPDKAPKKNAESKPEPSATPEPKIDSKTEAEILQAEERFINAIKNNDAKALTEILHEYYADALGRYAKKATNKRGTLDRASKGRLPAYRIEKERKISQSTDSFTVEGLAKAERQNPGDEPPDKWFRVNRIWTKTEDRWVLNAQAVFSVEKAATEKDAEAKEKN